MYLLLFHSLLSPGTGSGARWELQPWHGDARTAPELGSQAGSLPGAGNAAGGCWSLTRWLPNTQNPFPRCPCCWWHLWNPGWEQSRGCCPGGSTGNPSGPIAELVYMGVAQLHPASPALLPSQQLLATLECFPLFGCWELFWSRDVNTEPGPTAGRCEVTRGRRSPPSEGRSAGAPVSSCRPGARPQGAAALLGAGEGGAWGAPGAQSPRSAPGRGELGAKQGFHNPLGSACFGEPVQSHPWASHLSSPALQKCSSKTSVLLRGWL